MLFRIPFYFEKGGCTLYTFRIIFLLIQNFEETLVEYRVSQIKYFLCKYLSISACLFHPGFSSGCFFARTKIIIVAEACKKLFKNLHALITGIGWKVMQIRNLDFEYFICKFFFYFFAPVVHYYYYYGDLALSYFISYVYFSILFLMWEKFVAKISYSYHISLFFLLNKIVLHRPELKTSLQ